MNLSEITKQPMLARLSEISAQRPEIETLIYILGNEKILEWVHSVGVSTDHKLRDIAPNIPPFELRNIVAAPSESVFLWSGLKDAQMCANYFKNFQKNIKSDSEKILDFGCGCGRTTRFLQEAQQFEVYGSDINKHLVAWCQDNLKMVTTMDNEVLPPLKFSDGYFDFVYSLSIFTHLPELSMFAWLDELARVTSDNGIVLLTTHGYPAIEIICQSKQHQQMFQIAEDDAIKLRDTFEQKQFVYRPLSADVVNAANAGDDYGNSFTHESFIRKHWARDVFDVIEFIPGGMRGWQDVTILRRRPRSL
jgi:SAM-dependent methyltransferase